MGVFKATGFTGEGWGESNASACFFFLLLRGEFEEPESFLEADGGNPPHLVEPPSFTALARDNASLLRDGGDEGGGIRK